jgi:hypothetical protein
MEFRDSRRSVCRERAGWRSVLSAMHGTPQRTFPITGAGYASPGITRLHLGDCPPFLPRIESISTSSRQFCRCAAIFPGSSATKQIPCSEARRATGNRADSCFVSGFYGRCPGLPGDLAADGPIASGCRPSTMGIQSQLKHLLARSSRDAPQVDIEGVGNKDGLPALTFGTDSW